MVAFGGQIKCAIITLVFAQICVVRCIEHGHTRSNRTRYGHPEERSGHLEGDILGNLKSRNGLNDPNSRWRNKVLPFVIAPGYSKLP